MKLNKIVGLGLAIALGLNLVGCKSTTDTPTESEIELNQSKATYEMVYQEIEESLPYECMEVSDNHYRDDKNYWLLTVIYVFDSKEEGVMNFKQEREKRVNKMVDYHREVNEKYNPLGIQVTVKVCYTYDQFDRYCLITEYGVDDNNFIVEEYNE
jgi:hypothetical protein